MTTPILTNEKASRSLTEFEFVYDSKDRPSKLGKGSFANVRLVQEKKTGKLFALKMINVNSTRISRSELHNLRTEIQIHRQLDHPNIIKFDGYIQEGLNIYLVLDYAQNGNLYSYLHKKKVLTPNEVFHFFYQSCLAIQYLHEKDFVHRDIKPENLLLDKDLNIKVCDFGWSAKSIKEKRITFCGTYEYMAPEIVRKKPYDYRVDIWSLGVLLYELIHREAPYKGRNLPEILNSLSNTTLTFCPSVQPEVKHLIQSILKIDPNERSSISDILNHPWIKYHLHKKDYTHQNPISAFLTPTKPTNREPQVEEQDQDLYISQDLIPPQEQLTDEPYPSIFEIPVQQVSARKLKNSPAIQIPTLPIHSNRLGEGSYGFHQASPRAISQLNSPPPSKILKDHEYENAPFTPVKPMNFNEDFYSNKNYGFSSATLPKKVAENWAAFDSRKMSNDPGSRKLFEKDIMSPDFNLKLNSILGQLNGNAASAKKEGASEPSILSARYHSNQPKPTNYEGSISFRGYDMPAARENSIGSRQLEQRDRERENLHNATSDYSNNTSIDNCNKAKFNSENSKAALRPVSNNHALNTALQARADPSQNMYVPTFKINFVSTKYQQNSSNSSFQKHPTFDLNKSAQKAMMENSMHRRNPNVSTFDEMVNSLCKSARVENKPGYDGYLIQSSNLNDVQRKLFKVSNNNTPLKENPAPLSERGIDRNKENLTGSAGDRRQVMYDRMYTQR